MSGKTMACLDGAIAGLIGASIVAVSFLFIDTVTHLPLYTPTVLGEGLFLREQSFAPKTGERVSLELTLMYSGVHGLVFIALGMIAAFLLSLPKRKVNFGMTLLALFAVLELGFVGTTFFVAKPLLHELAWPIVVLGNFLAACGMTCYLSIRGSGSN